MVCTFGLVILRGLILKYTSVLVIKFSFGTSRIYLMCILALPFLAVFLSLCFFPVCLALLVSFLLYFCYRFIGTSPKDIGYCINLMSDAGISQPEERDG